MNRRIPKMACVLLAVMLLAGCSATFQTGKMDLTFDVGEKVGDPAKGAILHHDASVPGLTINWSGDPEAAVTWLVEAGKKLAGAFLP